MGWESSDRRDRLPADWPARRQRALRRDGYRCTVTDNGRRCTNPAREVDHVEPGDNHADSNLRSICTTHHRAKSSAEGVAAQPRRKRPPEPHPGLL